MFNSFNRAGHRELSSLIATELDELGKRLGVKLTVGGGKIATTTLSIYVDVESLDTTAIDNAAKLQLQQNGRYYGVEESDYGLVFTSMGKRFKFTGVSPSRPKFPLNGECMSTGRSFKFGKSTAQRIVEARPPVRTAAEITMSGLSPLQDKGDPRFAHLAQF